MSQSIAQAETVVGYRATKQLCGYQVKTAYVIGALSFNFV